MTILEVQRAICSRFSMAESIEIEKAIEHYISRRVDGDTYFKVFNGYKYAWVYVCNSSDESAATIAGNLEGNHYRDRVYIYGQPKIVSDIYEAMVNSDIQIVDVSELTNGNPIDFDALEPYQNDIDVDPDNGHIIALTSFINHFYE